MNNHEFINHEVIIHASRHNRQQELDRVREALRPKYGWALWLVGVIAITAIACGLVVLVFTL